MLYHSKQGHTKTCIDYLNNRTDDTCVVPVQDFTASLDEYDSVIIGTPVYMGNIHKMIKTFIQQHEQTLLQKSLTIVVCAMNDSEYEAMIQRNFTESIRNHARIVHAGGGYNFKRLNFLERFIVKKIAKVDSSISSIKYDQLDSISM